MNKLLLALIALGGAAIAQTPDGKPAAERVFECTGEVTAGRKAPFREVVVLSGSTATIRDMRLELSSETGPDFFDYVANPGKSHYQLTLFRKTGRFKYSTYVRGLMVAEGDCKRIERSTVFE